MLNEIKKLVNKMNDSFKRIITGSALILSTSPIFAQNWQDYPPGTPYTSDGMSFTSGNILYYLVFVVILLWIIGKISGDN
jgi:hypothetical protein